MKFVIFHGAFGTPQDNWFPQLKDQLEELGQEVFAPQFPTPKNQSLTTWLSVFEKEILPEIKNSLDLCFIGHSLGPLFILHAVNRFNLSLDSAIFVSPFLTTLAGATAFNKINKSFYKTDFDFGKLKKLIPISYVLYSDNDPYVEKYHSIGFGKRMGASLLLVRRAGHMNTEVNLNEFPLVFELCKTRLDLSLYQQYMAHRRDLYAIDYISPKSEEVIFLEPQEVFDEGVFKFRNLKKYGFCTFLTSLKFWDTQGAYYQQSRLAARRVKDFTRVFMIDKIDDLKKDLLQRQIKLDIASGMKVYLCLVSKVKNKIGELDFGLWDYDYLCSVHFDRDKQVEVKLSSRKKDIKEGLEWRDIILRHSTKITNTDKDIERFIKRGLS